MVEKGVPYNSMMHSAGDALDIRLGAQRPQVLNGPQKESWSMHQIFWVSIRI